ncbi:MAG: nuclear transport factor 2 family protein [Parasphingorhabdus sp.]|uniref:nuclear transport factor 2 family protein n=1 Tax=Parasphingorhabdus sp. TaxID=2709688 RepID=UPI00329A6382
MTRTQKILSTAVLATGALSAGANAETKPAETQESVAADLQALDGRLFKAAFEDCDMAVLEDLLADDLEFYHDRDGLSYTSSAGFIADVKKECGGGKRVLVADSMTTHMIGDYGAMQHGRHEFHQVMPDGSSIAREKGVFMHMWQRTAGNSAGWQITRVISYDHEGM